MLYFPTEPDLPAEQRTSGPVHLRYEDICQDGRMTLYGLTTAVGQVVWRKLISPHPITHMARTHGIIPILTRLVLVGTEETVSIARPLDAGGSYQLAHTRDAGGEVDRLLLNMWVELRGVRGRTYAPGPVDGAGEPVTVGRVFAEHVCTRLFAPPDQRKVLAFPGGEMAAVPETRWQWRGPQAVLELPADAELLDGEPVASSPIAFGLADTDSNKHVNSLVYPRRWEHEALQRMAAHGLPTVTLARYAEVTYRKPCFAGEKVRIVGRLYRRAGSGAIGLVGSYVPADEPAGKPHCSVHMLFG